MILKTLLSQPYDVEVVEAAAEIVVVKTGAAAPVEVGEGDAEAKPKSLRVPNIPKPLKGRATSTINTDRKPGVVLIATAVQ